MSTELIVMRLKDMERVHPDQIEMTCSQCGHVVGVFPSGQAALKQHPEIKLVCQFCRPPGVKFAGLAPGAEFEPFQTVKKL